MRTLKIRVELNKGRKGIPIHKLSALTEEIERFFQRVGLDLGIQTPKEGWLAVRFGNGSVSFDAEYQGHVSEDSVREYENELVRLPRLVRPNATTRLSQSTILQFARIGDPIDEDEHVSFGVYRDGTRKSIEWQNYTKSVYRQIAETVITTSEYRGVVQGVVHSWFKEVSPPYFYIRDSTSGRMVKCFYDRNLYEEVVKLLQKKNAVVQVIGMVTANFVDRRVEEVRAEKFGIAEALSDDDFEKFFGMAPDLTGDLATADYIASIRDNAE